jgi:hypothetical protein
MRVLAYSVISLSYAIYLGLDVFIAEKTSLQLLHLCYLFFTCLCFSLVTQVITNNVEFNSEKKVKSNRIQQVGNQKSSHSFTQMPHLKSSYRINTINNIQVPKQHIKCITPMTFRKTCINLKLTL